MTDKETPMAAILFFKRQNIPSQDFVIMNISWKFEISTYDTLALEGQQNFLLKVEKLPWHPSCFFRMRQDFMVVNISCKFQRSI